MMKIGLGIDTGGTYTDAVIYDFDTKEVRAAAKSLTTKEDLSLGITDAIRKLAREDFTQIQLVALSTTLATNACVEGKGGRAQLIILGGDRNIIERRHAEFGLPDISEIYFVDGKVNLEGVLEREPDWEQVKADLLERSQECKSFAVSGHLASRNPILEQKIKKIILELGCKAICSTELATSELNYIKRASTALLNAKLIPVITEFLDSIRLSMTNLKIQAPVYIVRSDGSLMRESFAMERPIETLLCGPTASVVGAMHLVGAQQAVIVDIGGTTTDLAMVQNGIPVKTENGVTIGAWQTSVCSTYIETFGLGGDSRIHLEKDNTLLVGPERVVPLCVLASRYPTVCDELKQLVQLRYQGRARTYEFFELVKKEEKIDLTAPEKAICDFIKDTPKSIYAIAEHVGYDVYTLPTERLEKIGVLMRCGFTPTDGMHLQGTFNQFCTEASRLGAIYFNHCLDISTEDLCKRVYDGACYRLYSGIVKLLMNQTNHESPVNVNSKEMEAILYNSYYHNVSTFATQFHTDAVLIGVGAPTHIFLAEVAKKLNTTTCIPSYAHVANAIGAAVCTISVCHTLFLKPVYTAAGLEGYNVLGTDDVQWFEQYEEAVEYAQKKAAAYACAEAIRRGLTGEMEILYGSNHNESVASVQDGLLTVDLGSVIAATVTGKIFE